MRPAGGQADLAQPLGTAVLQPQQRLESLRIDRVHRPEVDHKVPRLRVHPLDGRAAEAVRLFPDQVALERHHA